MSWGSMYHQTHAPGIFDDICLLRLKDSSLRHCRVNGSRGGSLPMHQLGSCVSGILEGGALKDVQGIAKVM